MTSATGVSVTIHIGRFLQFGLLFGLTYRPNERIFDSFLLHFRPKLGAFLSWSKTQILAYLDPFGQFFL